MDPKRKVSSLAVSPSASPDMDERGSKRRKLTGVPAVAETPETTAQHGFVFLEQIKQAKDKRGRLVATSFLELPDKEEYPDYYVATVLPIALDTIEAKLARRGYPNLTTLESDLKRMVTNAKAYNEKGSEIWGDAEKIRKIAVEFMRKHNPAYRDPRYIPFPTPLPGTSQSTHGSVQGDEKTPVADGSAPAESPALPPPAPSAVDGRGGSPPSSTIVVASDHAEPKRDFEGKTFQEAQEMIMAELIGLKNQEGDEIAEPFLNLPSRKLTDYYALIKKPVSLRAIQKRVRGVRGRNDVSGVSDFKSWEAFEEQTSLIWRNAREYNEEGSDITLLAGELEAFFNRRLAEAKEMVGEPAQTNGDSIGTQRLKLKMSNSKSADTPAQKILLRVGGARHKTPAATSDTTAKAVSPVKESNNTEDATDRNSVDRQPQDVQAGVNGHAATNDRSVSQLSDRGARAGSGPAPPSTLGPPALDERNNSAASPRPSSSDVKSESSSQKSPSLGAVGPSTPAAPGPSGSDRALTAADVDALMMPPPPSVTPRNLSGSPHPPHAGNHTRNSQPLPAAYNPKNPFETKSRAPGKDASDALITNLGISTHPGLALSRHFHLDIPASATATQQSVTVSLPSTHYYLNIVPTTAASLLNRPYRIHVTVGTQRLAAMPHSDPKAPVYEARLVSGVNRIDVEIVAGAPPRSSPSASEQEIEYEKFTVFAHLLKASL